MERRLAAILSVDMVGYSRLVAENEAATLAAQKRVRSGIVDPAIARFRGRIVKSTGDGLLAEFASVVDALRCAVTVQLALKGDAGGAAAEPRIVYRMGINLGDIVVEDGDIYGDGVNVAARLEQMAEPGGICVSRTVAEQARGRVASGLADLGLHELKNIPEPVRVFRVEPVPEADDAAPVAPWRGRRIAGAGLLAAAAVAAAVLAWRPWERGAPVIETPERAAQRQEIPASVAVLPLTNMGGDPAQAFFADGVTDDIIIKLTKVPGLFVIDRESTFNFREAEADAQDVARALGVRYLLRGSVRRSDDKVRISAKLIDMSDGRLVWGETYDGELNDVFALQTAIAARIAESLAVSVAGSDPFAGSGAGTQDFKAYDLYLKGREQFLRFSRDSTFAARRLFEAALLRDPAFSDALAMLAWTHAFEYNNGWAPDPSTALDRALELSERAIALNDRLPIAHFVKALVHRERREIALAMAEASLAIEINPSYANAYVMLATLLYYDGQPAAGLAMIERAEKLNPLHPSNYPFHKGQALFILGRYDEAIEVLRRGLLKNPTSQRLRVWLTASYVATGKLDEAEWEADQILLDDPDFRMDRLNHVFPFTDPDDYERFRTALGRVGFANRM